MENQVVNYTFSIIEDGQVPLAGNFDTFSYAPVLVVVALGFVLLAVLAYTLWYEPHSMRIRTLCADENLIATKNYFFHPFKLLRDESELEYSLSNVGFDR